MTLVAARPRFDTALCVARVDVALVAAWAVALAVRARGSSSSPARASSRAMRPAATGAAPRAGACRSRVRRIVEIAIVASCVALPAIPAHAAAPRPPLSPGALVRSTPVVRTSAPPAPVPAAIPAPERSPADASRPHHRRTLTRDAERGSPTTSSYGPATISGCIARARTSAARSGRRPTDAEVARYWRAVIAANRSTLRSGDPSLIFPGEIVTAAPGDSRVLASRRVGILAGKVAVVTGAGGGIGRGHARLLAEEGAHVVVNDLDTGRAARTVSEVTDEVGSAAPSTHNVATWAGGDALVQQAIDDLRTTRHPREQRRDPARRDDVQHDRGRVGLP